MRHGDVAHCRAKCPGFIFSECFYKPPAPIPIFFNLPYDNAFYDTVSETHSSTIESSPKRSRCDFLPSHTILTRLPQRLSSRRLTSVTSQPSISTQCSTTEFVITLESPMLVYGPIKLSVIFTPLPITAGPLMRLF